MEHQSLQNFDFATIRVCLADGKDCNVEKEHGLASDASEGGRASDATGRLPGTGRIRRLLRFMSRDRLPRRWREIDQRSVRASSLGAHGQRQHEDGEDANDEDGRAHAGARDGPESADSMHDAAKAELWDRDEARYKQRVGTLKACERRVTMGIGDEGPCRTLLSLLRVAVATPSELAFLQARADDEEMVAAGMATEPLCQRNELAAHRALLRLLEAQLGSRRVGEEGARAAAPGNLNRLNAQMIVRAERRVLIHLRRMSEASISFLEAPEDGSAFDRGLDYASMLQNSMRSQVRLE